MKHLKTFVIIGFPFLLAAALIVWIKRDPPTSNPANILITPEQTTISSAPAITTTAQSVIPIDTKSAPPEKLVSHPGAMDAGNPTPAHEVSPGHDPAYAALYEKVTLLLRQQKEGDAIRVLNEIIQMVPSDLQAHTLLGDLYYKRDQVDKAIFVWEKMLKNDPANERIQFLLEKARRERDTQTKFVHESTRHFTIKFEGAESRSLYKTVLDILEEAYGEVGRALLFYPTEEIIVFLYTDQQFFDVTRAPAWTGGIFDGKIRIPTKGSETRLPVLRRILFHEYVHAMLHQMRKGGTSRVGEFPIPTWLNEGVAQYFEPESRERTRELNARLQPWIKLDGIVPLSQLHGSFLGVNDPRIAALIYDESLSAVSFLVGRFGIWRLKMLLEDLPTKQNLDEAMQSALLVSYENFQSNWEDALKGR